MESGNKYKLVSTKFGENGENELIILLLHLTLLQQKDYILEFCEEIIESFEVSRLK